MEEHSESTDDKGKGNNFYTIPSNRLIAKASSKHGTLSQRFCCMFLKTVRIFDFGPLFRQKIALGATGEKYGMNCLGKNKL